MEKTIEIPFGAKDSELKGWEYTIPEDMEAEIKDGKIIVKQKESEDERIRKWIIDEIKATHDYDSPTSRKSVDDAIAYLEKQKEQKPESCDCSRDEESYTNGIHHVLMNPEAYGLIKLKSAKWSEDTIRKAIEEVGLTQHQINWFKNNVFPPKQEWSEEDKKNFGEAISYIKDDSLRDFLKSLPERFNLQPRTGWSEEDKTNGWTGADLERYLSCLQRLGTGNPQQPETINSKWFKEHCHPRPYWNPSEKQILAIVEALKYIPNNKEEWIILENLMHDLQNYFSHEIH